VRELLRKIPQVSKLIEEYRKVHGDSPLLRMAIKNAVDKVRREVLEGKRNHLEDLGLVIEEELKRLKRTNLRRVINATGVVINTNLGRSVLSEETANFIKEIATHYSNLEFDLEEGRRGSRVRLVEELLVDLIGCESAHVVNNNAGAVFLVLNTHAKDREVIVSRGELVEIGGSFRVPDIMRASGAILVEVGTTNKTRLQDYKNAISPNTALIMKVHKSNFYMEGFVEEVKAEELLSLGLPVYYDAGSGLLMDLRTLGINYEEPSFEELIKKGLHLVSGSGDKLLGGPQAGLILGKREFVEPLKKNPLSRVLRIDKLTLSALEHTLRLYREERYEEIPTLRMLSTPEEELKKKAKKVAKYLKNVKGLSVSIVRELSVCGGGSLPELKLPTYCVAIKHQKLSPQELYKWLLKQEPPVVGRLKDDLLLFDMRTVLEEDIKPLISVLKGLEF
jgi:L-seryl-tRNA(Ser) seleniumtransferase